MLFSLCKQQYLVHTFRPCSTLLISCYSDVPLIISADELKLDDFLGTGKSDNEVELPEEENTGDVIAFNETAMAQLEGMGFPLVRCQKALLATGNADPEAAMNWLFAHMEDPGKSPVGRMFTKYKTNVVSVSPDIDSPIPSEQLTTSSGSTSAASGPSADAIAMVADMGFSPDQARKALNETSGNIEAAVEWLFSNPGDPGVDEATIAAQPVGASSKALSQGSAELPATYRLKAFISHKGNSIHVGHYVAHIHEPGIGWVLFNDEKVGRLSDGQPALKIH